jgi:hypothetical protein
MCGNGKRQDFFLWYDLTTVMQVKKNIFNNWMECHMCGDYCSMNKWTCLDKYSMPLLKQNFDALGQSKLFNTLDL